MAARAIWKARLRLRDVLVPVKLYSAIEDRKVHFRLLHAKDRVPVTQHMVDPRTEKPVPAESIRRGVETGPGEIVMLTAEELHALEPEKSREIDLRLFVPAAQIDPVYLDRTYLLVPTGDSPKAYRLLAATMENTGRAGIATFVMRGKEYLVAIEAQNGVIYAETLRFAAEIRTPDMVGLPAGVPVPASGITALRKEIQAATVEWFPIDEMRDEYAERLRNLVERKQAAGKDVVHPVEEEPENEGVEVIDLMEVLKRSIEGHGSARHRRRNTAPDRSATAAGDDLRHQSKAALYARATAMGLPGRSRMGKKELIETIRKNTP